jgi:hypothetical protein
MQSTLISRARTRRLVAGVALAALAVGAVACGDDDSEASETTQAEATETTEAAGDEQAADEPVGSEEFCSAFVDLETAFAAAPSDDQEALVPYIQEEVIPPLEIVGTSPPEEIADDVTVMADAVELVTTSGDFSGFESEGFAAASAVVYPWVGENCDLPWVEAVGIDFGYEGVPDELEAGPTVITLDNQSAAGEVHEIAFARVNDGVDLGLHELLALPMEELEQNVTIASGVFAMPDQVGGTVLDLTPGRWVYVCLVPTGSVDGAEGDGPPHVAHGMSGEFTVS